MKRIATLIALACMSFVHIAAQDMLSTGNTDVHEEHTPVMVLIKYKTQPGKEQTALVALRELISKVASEPYHINITIYADPHDATNILLFEQWESETYFKTDHSNTPHLQEFIASAMAFLAGPPELSFWREH